jgi:hypothetical protein
LSSVGTASLRPCAAGNVRAGAADATRGSLDPREHSGGIHKARKNGKGSVQDLGYGETGAPTADWKGQPSAECVARAFLASGSLLLASNIPPLLGGISRAQPLASTRIRTYGKRLLMGSRGDSKSCISYVDTHRQVQLREAHRPFQAPAAWSRLSCRSASAMAPNRLGPRSRHPRHARHRNYEHEYSANHRIVVCRWSRSNIKCVPTG